MTGRRTAWAAIGGAVVIVAAWLAVDLLPRWRAGEASCGHPAASLMCGGDEELVLWVAHPHQNLRVLARRFDHPQLIVEGLATMIGEADSDGAPRGRLWSVPPAHALGVAWSRPDRVEVVLEAHALTALAMRGAGAWQGDPWLRGGRLQAESGMQVRWEGNVWRLHPTLPSSRLEPSAGPATAPARALAMVMLRQPWGAAPAGSYVLEAGRGDIHLRTGSIEEHQSETLPESIALALQDDRGLLVVRTTEDDGRAQLPDSAVLYGAEGRRHSMLAEGVADLLGYRLTEREEAGRMGVGMSRESLDAAFAVAPRLRSFDGEGRAVVLVRRSELERAVGGLRRAIDQFPFIARKERAFWRGLHLLLTGLAPYELIVIEAGPEGAYLRLTSIDDPLP